MIKRMLLAAAAAALIALPAATQTQPDRWDVHCLWNGNSSSGGVAAGGEIVWRGVTKLKRSEGGFDFVDMDGGVTSTSAGLSCHVGKHWRPN